MMDHLDKLNRLAERIQEQGKARYAREMPDSETNFQTRVKLGSKYAKIDRATWGQWSGHLMVDEAGNVFGIKGYGVIHKGHQYGTLDTIDDYDWSGYYPWLITSTHPAPAPATAVGDPAVLALATIGAGWAAAINAPPAEPEAPYIDDGTLAAIGIVREEWNEAVAKAWDALGRYKFEMFGYWASKSVSYGQLLEKLGVAKPASPFRELVNAAREQMPADEVRI